MTAVAAPPPIREQERRVRQLRIMRQRATGLLLLTAVAFVIIVLVGNDKGAWGYAQAALEASMVGGVADWFAVTALFRHPLGLPIPHTAIIPRQKARLGRALGRFVAGHVITPAEVSRVLGRLDVPAIFSRFLRDPEASGPTAQALA